MKGFFKIPSSCFFMCMIGIVSNINCMDKPKEPNYTNKQKAIYALALLTNEINTMKKKLDAVGINVDNVTRDLGTVGENIDNNQLDKIGDIVFGIKAIIFNVSICNKIQTLEDFKARHFAQGKAIIEAEKQVP